MSLSRSKFQVAKVAAKVAARVAARLPARLSALSLGVLVIATLLFVSAGSATDEQPAAAAASPFPMVTLSTSMGDIVLELDRERAPASVANFLTYVNEGFYSNTIFHRVIEGFMIQGGGFTADYERKQTRAAIRNEANNGLKNLKYSIAMARTNAPHSATAQFFINGVDNDYLDYRDATARDWGYAVFGRVVDGFDVVDQISQVDTGAGGPFSRDAPKTPIVILSVTEQTAASEDTAVAAETTIAPTTKTE